MSNTAKVESATRSPSNVGQGIASLQNLSVSISPHSQLHTISHQKLAEVLNGIALKSLHSLDAALASDLKEAGLVVSMNPQELSDGKAKANLALEPAKAAASKAEEDYDKLEGGLEKCKANRDSLLGLFRSKEQTSGSITALSKQVAAALLLRETTSKQLRILQSSLAHFNEFYETNQGLIALSQNGKDTLAKLTSEANQPPSELTFNFRPDRDSKRGRFSL